MKKYLKFKGIALCLFLVLGFVSCNNDDNGIVDPIPSSDKNIVQLATESDNLSNLVAALQRADLVATLEGEGKFTVLAPTNEAFAKYLAENGYASLEEVPVEALKQVVLNHVIAGRISSVDLIANQAGYTFTLADAALVDNDDAKLNIFYDTSNGIEFNGDAEVVQNGADIGASNGVIHVVDDVIELPTVATFIDADPVFDSLDDALDVDGQPDFEKILETTAGTAPTPFTVFAPINQAFTSLTKLPTGETLTAILQHHVIVGNNIRFSNTDSADGTESPATLEGDTVQFSQTGNRIIITDGAGNSNSEIIPQLANIQATNGVVHGITSVLLPNTENNGGEAVQ